MTDPSATNPLAIELRHVGYEIESPRAGPNGSNDLDGSHNRALLRDLNLAVTRGETLILLGRSGAGKTTALKLINRLLERTSGEIFIHGKPQSEWDPVRLRRGMGYVMQGVGLFPHWTVEQNVAMIPRLEGWEESRVQARVREMLSLVGLKADEFARRRPHELSGGQSQRVGVARALAADPPILLMDEPFGALDPVTRSELQREFRALTARLDKTIAFVTHDVREALLLGTRIALLANGQLVGVYTPAQFLQSTHPETQIFVNSLGDATPGSTAHGNSATQT